MRVVELWRFPVKSLQGERLDSVEIGVEGVEGDRQWALFDTATGFGLTARRVPELLFGAARLGPDGDVQLVLPDGTVTVDDAVLSAWLGRRVELRSASAATERARFEAPDDNFAETLGGWHDWMGGGGAFHDDSDGRVSLISTATLGGWDRRRFRSNVVLDGDGEDELVGARLRLGDATLQIGRRIPRCVMVTRPQPGGIGRETAVLRTIHRERGGELAIGAGVLTPGRVRIGDLLEPV